MQLVYLRPPASLACAFAGVQPSQRTWSNSKGSDHHPVGYTSNLLGLGGALPQLFPHTSLFYRVLSPSFIRCHWNNSILCFLYCTDVLMQAEWGGCLLLAELNYYLKISPAPAVPSLTAPKTFDPRVKSQWLHQGCYLRCVCLHRVKNTCNTPDQRTIAQMTPLRCGKNRYTNRRRRSRSGFFSCSIPGFSFPFLS